MLALEPIGPDRFRSYSLNAGTHGHLFGGSIYGQALRAAALTTPDRHVHSSHGYYLRTGTESEPVVIEVDRLRDGRTFSSRRVAVLQEGKPIFELLASFHAEEPGHEHQSKWSPPPPPPDGLRNLSQLADDWADRLSPEIRLRFLHHRWIELRFVEPEDFLMRRSAPSSSYWFRCVDVPPALDRGWHFAALALASDFMFPSACRMPYCAGAYDDSAAGVSLDHSIWFHGAVDASAWHLCETMSPWAGSGRGLNLGRVYDESGRLVASLAQEMLMRPLGGAA